MSERPWDNLTKIQRDMAEYLQLGHPDTGENLTVVKACEYLNLARSTYYDWLKRNPEFTDYMDYLADTAVKANMGKYDRILDKMATNSDNEKIVLDAINVLYKRGGKFKNDVNLHATIDDNKSIGEKTLDELKRDLEKMNHSEAGSDT